MDATYASRQPKKYLRIRRLVPTQIPHRGTWEKTQLLGGDKAQLFFWFLFPLIDKTLMLYIFPFF